MITPTSRESNNQNSLLILKNMKEGESLLSSSQIPPLPNHHSTLKEDSDHYHQTFCERKQSPTTRLLSTMSLQYHLATSPPLEKDLNTSKMNRTIPTHTTPTTTTPTTTTTLNYSFPPSPPTIDVVGAIITKSIKSQAVVVPSFGNYSEQHDDGSNNPKKRTRQQQHHDQQDNGSTDDDHQFKSDLVSSDSQRKKMENSIMSVPTTRYQPMEDSTLLLLMDMVCKIVEKKEVVHSPNLSSDLTSCCVSSNDSYCSSPQTTQSGKLIFPTTLITSEDFNVPSVVSSNERNKKPNRTSISIKELLN